MERYVKPQENGSHYGTEFMEITDGKTILRAEDGFSFSALPYSSKQLTDCKHDWELPERETPGSVLTSICRASAPIPADRSLTSDGRLPKKVREALLF